MIRLAIDSDNLADLTADVDFIITYSDLVHDAAAFEAEHPGRQCVYIDRGNGDPGDKATIIDVETGAYNPSHLSGWYDAKAAAKLAYLTYYCNRATLPAIQAVIGGRHMWRWIAVLDGTIAIAGFVPWQSPDLIQLLGAPQLGVHADLSLVLSPSWHPAPPAPKLASAMMHIQDAGRDASKAASELAAAVNYLRQI
jgi:hypothetical protein